MQRGRGWVRWAGMLLVCPVLASFQRSSALDDLRGALERRTPGETVERDELVHRLVERGTRALPTLYALSSGDGLGELVGDGFTREGWLCLPEEIPDLCIDALARMPAVEVRGLIERALDRGVEAPERFVQLRILAAQRAAEGLDLVLREARELGPLGLSSTSLRAALADALSAILRDDARAWERAENARRSLEPGTLELLADAVAASGRPRGMELLEEMLRQQAPSPLYVAECMARLEEERPWDLQGRTLGSIGPWLRAFDPDQRACAARIAGRLGSLEQVSTLIGLVEDTDPLVRRRAHAALESLAAHPLAAGAEEIEAWYDREETWRETHWPQLLTDLHGTPAQAREALRELARHPLFRREVVRAVAATLGEARDSALILCSELERQGSRLAVPGLLQALDSGVPRLRAAAWRALRKITGEERELAPARWREWLDP